ncbi:MAG: 50S ribosomal protein L19 [Spirochaetales bacterium]
MDPIKAVEVEQMKEGVDDLRIGDLVRVHFTIIEGKTERVQVYEGVIIAMKNAGLRKTITVRKVSYGVGVERVFPVHSPRIQKIELVRHGRIRRAKLYYLRERVGKAAKIVELIQKKKVEPKVQEPPKEPTTEE